MKTSIPPVETFRRLICLQANRCWERLPVPRPCDFDDLSQEGFLVYKEAERRYDPRRRTKFITLFTLMLQQHFCRMMRRFWRQKNRQEPLNTRLPQILSVIQPAVPATWEEFFCQRLSELARSFVREFLTPSAEFQTFCQERYKKITDNPNLLRRRIFEYLGCENRRRKEIVAELRLKLSGSLARAS